MAATEVGHVASRAVDDLYREHGREVYRYAYAVLGNHADAEDVTQTTFLNAYRALGQGVQPRKPSNWLLAIASNAIKQRFRQEQARPREVELDERIVGSESDEEAPSIGELLTALGKIPPKQRQAIVLREFEGRTYGEMAEILGVTTSALETLLFRARRSLAEELEHQLTCLEAQQAVSRAVDGRLGRKERRRLRAHLAECPDCAHFARLQPRHRSALRGLMLVPVPLSFPVLEGLGGPETASAATTSVVAGEGATLAATGGTVGSGVGLSGATGASAIMGGVALKAAAVVAAVTIAGGLALEGAQQLRGSGDSTPTPLAVAAQTPMTEAFLQRGAALTQTSVTPTSSNADTAPQAAATGRAEELGGPPGVGSEHSQPHGHGGALPGAPQTEEQTGDERGGHQPLPDEPRADEPRTDEPRGGQPQGEVPPPGDVPPGEEPQAEVPEAGAPQRVEPPAAALPTQPATQTQSSTKQPKPTPAKQKQKKSKKPRPTTPAGPKPTGQQPPGHEQPKPATPKPEKESQADASKPETQANAEAPKQEKSPRPDEPKPENQPKAEDPKAEKEPKADEAATTSTPPSTPEPPTDKASGQKKP